jgi:phosphomethylpyrimidine synthase
VRNYAREKGIGSEQALEQGMAEKAEEFREHGSRVYREA